MGLLFELGNERQKLRALKALVVEVLGGSVGRGNDNGASPPEPGKQLPDHHRVRDIRHLQ